MSFDTFISGWLPVVGGLSGLVVIAYCCFMIVTTLRKMRQNEQILIKLSKLEGLLLGRRR